MGDTDKRPELSPLAQPISRRDVLKKSAVGLAGLSIVPAVIAACSSSAATASPPASQGSGSSPAASSGGGKLTGKLTVGSNQSDPAAKTGIANVVTAFAQSTGLTATVNTVDHNTFQDQITNYLQATPQDVFTWFSGYRMRFFASKGLTTPIDDVWAKVKDNFTAGFGKASTGDDGKVYGIPVDYYPWAIFYRKSVFAANGWTPPTNWNDFITLCNAIKAKGLVPIAFADKDGWPAMGTFDILNLRINGYDYHVNLLTGQNGAKWTDSKVTDVFNKWKTLIPFYTSGYAGLTWQQAADTLIRKQAGMYLLGLFVSQEFSAIKMDSEIDDLDFFAFPLLGTQYDSEQALDAPIDVWQMSAKSPDLPADATNAKAWLEFWAHGSTQILMLKAGTGLLPTGNDTDTSSYTALQKKAVQVVGQAQRITQFLDRDTRPDFAGANGMQAFLLKFLQNPNGDLASLQSQIQAFWSSLPPAA